MGNKNDKFVVDMMSFHNEFVVHHNRRDHDNDDTAVVNRVEHHEMNMFSYRKDRLMLKRKM
jgi:hypothetical protein